MEADTLPGKRVRPLKISCAPSRRFRATSPRREKSVFQEGEKDCWRTAVKSESVHLELIGMGGGKHDSSGD